MVVMKLSLGQLVSWIFEDFIRRYGDGELAAIATEATLNDFFLPGNPVGPGVASKGDG